jgi:site-specific DNA-methyltransferase (adenine-specific)
MPLPTPYYNQDGITIYHGDCREILPCLSHDALVLVTDPPYGINLGNHGGAKDKRGRGLRRGAYLSYADTPENYVSVVVPGIVAALDICVRGAVFGCAPSVWSLPAPDALGGVFIPAANGRSPWGFQNLAPVLLYGIAPDLNLGAKATMRRATGKADPDCGHPCPKPQEWMNWLVGLASKSGETVVDPFMGSGTTLRAAKDFGNKAIGIEIEEKYCEIAAKRLSQQVLTF